MELQLIKTTTDFELTITQKQKGKCLICVMNALSPVWEGTIKQALILQSRKFIDKNDKVYYIDAGNLDEKTSIKYQIFSPPEFLVFEKGKLTSKFSCSTEYHLKKQLKKKNFIK